MNSIRSCALPIIGFMFMALLSLGYGQQAPAPAPTSDGMAIDQGIAYTLMMVALAITYLMH
ncbi:arabinogalactan peptide 16-like [Pyrus ussuriensis x Pyrus communis]|uniref:Arabinogalactan peptide 16-like n=1 Tax=Pyrus ussuriensis x Pyrus communis TaxID=2448454 RepID=A0A5N5GSH5_9ROSA|nr:arabinogalactan peptide 16-like [Pyrus ussuriensis x Pyrus communis]